MYIFATLTNLTNLNMRINNGGSPMLPTSEDLQSLSMLKQLQTLTVHYEEFVPLLEFGALACLNHLTSLEFPQFLPSMKQLHHLHRLVLTEQHHYNFLQRLDIGGLSSVHTLKVDFEAESGFQPSDLVGFKRLTHLNLSMPDMETIHYAQLACLTDLQKLRLSTDREHEDSGFLAHLTNLTSLVFSYAYLDPLCYPTHWYVQFPAAISGLRKLGFPRRFVASSLLSELEFRFPGLKIKMN